MSSEVVGQVVPRITSLDESRQIGRAELDQRIFPGVRTSGMEPVFVTVPACLRARRTLPQRHRSLVEREVARGVLHRVAGVKALSARLSSYVAPGITRTSVRAEIFREWCRRKPGDSRISAGALHLDGVHSRELR